MSDTPRPSAGEAAPRPEKAVALPQGPPAASAHATSGPLTGDTTTSVSGGSSPTGAFGAVVTRQAQLPKGAAPRATQGGVERKPQGVAPLSPDDLEEVIQVLPRRAWYAVAGALIICVLFGVWAVFGEVETLVNANGILLRPGGVRDIYPEHAGMVRNVLVKLGDNVQVGQPIARILPVNLSREIQNVEAEIDRLRNQAHLLRLKANQPATQHPQHPQRPPASPASPTNSAVPAPPAHPVISHAAKYIAFLAMFSDTQTPPPLPDLPTLRAEAKAMEANPQTDSTPATDERPVSRADTISGPTTEGGLAALEQVEKLTLELVLRLRKLDKQADDYPALRSPIAGYVVELSVTEGLDVEMNTSLVQLELTGADGGDLFGIIYVDAADASTMVKLGMVAEIRPPGMHNEAGALVGEVTRIASFPSNKKQITRVIGHEELVNMWLRDKLLKEVYVTLRRKPTDKQAYEWTGRGASSLEIPSGTICTAQIIVHKTPPITLILPSLSRLR
ncbi:hypothetical protein DB346_06750 [Verrucomicrobia bacterium LW23]|nr:hypothetical protein DB346_06750 [Verrucomicrobia bacterium LW23]